MSIESPSLHHSEHPVGARPSSADGHRVASRSTQDDHARDPWMLPGFTDPVAGSQAAFRIALHALAHPGRVQTLPDIARITAPAPLSPAMAALLLTLADGDTPIWLAPEFGDAVRRFLRFHNGCTLTEYPEKAAFAVLSHDASTSGGGHWPSLQAFGQGDLANPHDATTLLIELPYLADPAHVTDDDGATEGIETVTLHGPGIAATQTVSIAGLPSEFWQQWRRNRAHFPQGVDVFLVSGITICGLPRTTQRES